jgi:alkyl hydroperoxide reductase subunit AhpF
MMATLDPALTTPAPAPSPNPPSAEMRPTEATTTLVIGSGFSGLAMAAELNRQGIKAIVVDCFCPTTPNSPALPTGGISLDAMAERSEIMRLLEHYARRHELDIRPSTCATALVHTNQEGPNERQWSVQTANGTVTAHSIVFTRGALNQLRRMLRGLGVNTGHDFTAALHSVGLYLVGVGDLVLPSTQEILHQAKRAGVSIAHRVALREGTPAAATA